MNKKVKRIIAVGMAVSAISVVGSTKYFNLTATKAYASTDNKGTKLKKISLGTGSIDFKSSQNDYTLQLDSDTDELRISATPEDDEATVSINGTEVTDSDNYEKVVSLDKGSNTITIKVEKRSLKRTYTITVMRGKEKQIYLESISLSAGNINFSQDKTEYNVDVPSDTSDISIKAIPHDTDYDEEIDEITTNDDDNYKRTVKLSNGNNDIPITIKDDDDHEKTYTLHINRGGADTKAQGNNGTGQQDANKTSTSTTANQQQTTTNNNTVTKGWVSSNGQWNYIDESGSKAVGWKQVNNVWYYLGSDGVMKTGWQNVNGEWYYLNINGAMKTGWLQNTDGKWYYLSNSGAMAKNTIIDGYRLNSDGVWIK
ncbi:cadherin-like beta sandwich domain-containing protein [uncultured Clostridium sp.]|uniref:cadherin-like beta sandwich domain-containing protein n=1 Tax=uncultured Clostridium sp. TaxID=59620 RepID=UPI0028E813A7|nr:cadherin-like beta sandwich domain-containing protein [uncultured Clostridium sp.]